MYYIYVPERMPELPITADRLLRSLGATRRLTIKHTVSKVTTAVCKDKTKNRSSRRSFPLSQEAREFFLSAKTEEQSIAGS